MDILGVVERRRVHDFGGDGAVARLPQRLGEAGFGRFRHLPLRVAMDIDAGAVLRADIVALAHALGRVVRLPEHLEQGVVGDFRRVEHDEDHLIVPGAAGADVLVGRVGRVATRIADRRGPYARGFPELAFGAPETAEAEQGALHALREGRRHRRAVDEMLGRNRHDAVAVRQGPVRGYHLDLLHQVEKHRGRLSSGGTMLQV